MHWVQLQNKKIKKNLRKKIVFLYWVRLFQWFIWFKQTKTLLRNQVIIICNDIPKSPAYGSSALKWDMKRNSNFSRRINDGKERMRPLLLPNFSGCKNNKIKQKTNPAAPKMKLFVTSVDGLLGKQLNNIKKNLISDIAGALGLPLFSILKKRLWFIYLFRTSSRW